MTRIYLSHPYGGKQENRESAAWWANFFREEWAKDEEMKDWQIVNPLEELKDEADRNSEDQMLGLAVELMQTFDGVIFAPGWKKSRGCRYEHLVARNTEGVKYFMAEVPA